MGNPRECRQHKCRAKQYIVCRENPHTDKGGLPFRTMGVANTALTCPAVLWTVEEMNKRSEARKLTRKRKRRF